MGIYSYFNIITQHFGQDNMSHAIPVPEQEEKHAYELPMRSHEGKTKLEKSWKQDPPMNSHQHTKLVLHGNQEKLYHWCSCHKSWTIHTPRECRKQETEKRRIKRSTGKPIWSRPKSSMERSWAWPREDPQPSGKTIVSTEINSYATGSEKTTRVPTTSIQSTEMKCQSHTLVLA